MMKCGLNQALIRRAQDLGLTHYAPLRPAPGPDPLADIPKDTLPFVATLSMALTTCALRRCSTALQPLTTRNRECGAIGPPGTRPY